MRRNQRMKAVSQQRVSLSGSVNHFRNQGGSSLLSVGVISSFLATRKKRFPAVKAALRFTDVAHPRDARSWKEELHWAKNHDEGQLH